MHETENSRYYTLQEQMENSFFRVPKALIYEEKYKNLKNDSKILYSYFLDKTDVSYFNKWVDEQGRLFIYCTIGTICNLLNVGESKASACKKELIKADLLEVRKKGQEKDTFYIKKPIVTVEHTREYYGTFIEESKNIDSKLRERVIKHRQKNNVPHCPETGKLLPQMKRENHVTSKNSKKDNDTQDFQQYYPQDYPQDNSVKYGELVEISSMQTCGQKCNVKSTVNETWNSRCSDTELSDTINSICKVDEPQSQQTNVKKDNQITYMYELEDNPNSIVVFMEQFGIMSEYQKNSFKNYQNKIENQLVEDIVIGALNKTKKVTNIINYTLKVLKENEKKNITTTYEYHESIKTYRNKCAGYAKINENVHTDQKDTNQLDTFMPDNFVPQETNDIAKAKEQQEIKKLANENGVDLSKYRDISLYDLKELIKNKNKLIEDKIKSYAEFMSQQEKLEMASEELGFAI